MPRRPHVPAAPATYVQPGGTWPAGPFVDDAPAAVINAAKLAARLTELMAEQGLTKAALMTEYGFARTTFNRTLAGKQFPDFNTVAVLEQHFGQPLWPTHGASKRAPARTQRHQRRH